MPYHLLLIGIISILGQVVLLRELSVTLYGIELIYILAIGLWLLMTGVGAVIGRRSFQPKYAHVILLFLLLCIFIPFDVAFVRGARVLFGGVPGAFLPLTAQLAAITITLLPICLILGLLFQWTAKLYVGTSNRTLARAYAIESAGGIIGGLAATWCLQLGVQNLTLALICSILAASAALVYTRQSFSTLYKLSAVVIIFALVMASMNARLIDYSMTRWSHPYLVDVRDTPYGRVTIRSLHDQISVFENDALSFETEGTTAEEFVHLSALQHPKPERILILGGGAEGLIRELQKYSPQKIDYVELNGAMLELTLRHVQAATKQSLAANNVRTFIADPRRFLNTSGQYDLILVAMPEPASGQTNRFYTREFFEGCAPKLSAGGVLAFRLKSAENLWTPQLKARTGSIYRALRTAFPYITVLPGATNIFIASSSLLPSDADVLSDRLLAGDIITRLVTPEYIRYLYTNDRFYKVRDILENEPALVNSDSHPVCYQFALMIWLSKFYPKLAFSELKLKGSGISGTIIRFSLVLLVALVIFFIIRRRDTVRRTVFVGMAGFIGMVMETVLILHYQTKNGILYQDIGLLLTAFMLGLALGAWAVEKLMSKRGKTKGRRIGSILLFSFSLIYFAIMILINSGISAGLLIIALSLTFTGVFVAGAFAYASLERVTDQRRVVSPLYAADLIGGCIGSLVSALFMIPVLGLTVTAGSMILITLMCLILI